MTVLLRATRVPYASHSGQHRSQDSPQASSVPCDAAADVRGRPYHENQRMSVADLITRMEHNGLLPPRPRCPNCRVLLLLGNLHARSREEELDLGGGVKVRQTVQSAMRCRPGYRYMFIFTGAELLNLVGRCSIMPFSCGTGSSHVSP